MAVGKTYTKIASQTSSGSSGTITFSNIPQNFTDLVLVSSILGTVNDRGVFLRFNSDTGSNYSATSIQADGSRYSSGRESSQTWLRILGYYFGVSTSTNYSMNITNIMNYSNSTAYKTILSRNNNIENGGGNETSAFVSLWRSTSSISSLSVIIYSGNFATGSTFTLYGIAASKAPKDRKSTRLNSSHT